MSMKDLEQALDLIKKEFSAEETDFVEGGIHPFTIAKAEEILGYRLPNIYKKFLEKLGCGGINSLEIYGLTRNEDFTRPMPFVASPNAVWTTLKWHHKFKHPLYLLVIYEVGEGTSYCLDTSQMNAERECPVVAWPIGGYEETPVLEVIAEDFGKFFLDMVEREIAYQKEEAAPKEK